MNVYPVLDAVGNVPYVLSYVTDLVAVAPVPVHPVVEAIVPPLASAVTVYEFCTHTPYNVLLLLGAIFSLDEYVAVVAFSSSVHPHVYPFLSIFGNSVKTLSNPAYNVLFPSLIQFPFASVYPLTLAISAGVALLLITFVPLVASAV